MLESVYRRETRYVRQDNGEALAVDHAIEHCFVREAVVPERKLVTEALKRGIGSVTVENVTARGEESSVDLERCSRSQDGDIKTKLKARRFEAFSDHRKRTLNPRTLLFAFSPFPSDGAEGDEHGTPRTRGHRSKQTGQFCPPV